MSGLMANPDEGAASESSQESQFDNDEFSIDSAVEALLSLDDEVDEEDAGEETAGTGAPEPSPEETDRYTVIVSGEEQEVELKELIDGYQRQSDYTRKTQAVAEERKKVEELIKTTESKRDQYEATLNQWGGMLEEQIKNAESSLPSLKHEDPEAYADALDRISQMKNAIKEVESKVSGITKEREAEYASKWQAYIEAEREMLFNSSEAKSVMPEFFDSAKQAAFREELKQFTMKQGFSEQEVNSLADHRAMILLGKAMKYDRIRQAAADAKNKRVAKNPKRVGRSTPTPSPASSLEKQQARADDAYKRLRKTGDPRDAGMILESLFTED